MNDIRYKKIEEKAFEKISKAMEKAGEVFGKKTFEELKEKNGYFKFKITDESVDRHGDVILYDGWDFKNFMKNPVVFWGHQQWEVPIGKVFNLIKNDEEKAVYIEGVFAPSEKAQEIRKVYEEGFINACSVGFNPLDYEKSETGGFIITEAELLELSLVGIPANAEALSVLGEKGFDIEKLKKMKVLEVETEEDEKQDDEEVDEKEKLKSVLENIDKEVLKSVLNFFVDLKKQIDETKEEVKEETEEVEPEKTEEEKETEKETEEEKEQDEKTDEEKEMEKHLEQKKMLQNVVGVISEVLHDLKKTK